MIIEKYLPDKKEIIKKKKIAVDIQLAAQYQRIHIPQTALEYSKRS